MEGYAIRGRVIDAAGDRPVEKGLVVVQGADIVYAGEESGYSLPAGIEVIDAGAGSILPGFIDCHAHLCGGEDYMGRPHFDSLLTAAYHMGLLLDAGFTYVRDMSLFGGALKRAVARGELRGPNVMPGGRVLSPVAGHVDLQTGLPVQVQNAISAVGYTADGVEGCLRAVREQFREGAEFIKICATGGVSSEVDGLEDVQYSDEEIAVMTAEAARHGTYVTAHCSNAKGTRQALENGVRCIEHGIELDERCIELMVKNNVPLVTTLYVSNLVATLSDFPAFMREKGKKAAQSHTKSMMKARAAGIRIAYGTDFSNSKNTPHLQNGLEFRAIVEAGFTPMEAIRAGTINAAHVLGRAGRLGTLEAGKQADIVVVDGNPLEDIGVLTHAEHVKLVMQGGAVKKRVQL